MSSPRVVDAFILEAMKEAPADDRAAWLRLMARARRRLRGLVLAHGPRRADDLRPLRGMRSGILLSRDGRG